MKYANEIFTSIDKTTTFAVEARFKRETADKPLMVFSEKSRFRFILIEGGKAIYQGHYERPFCKSAGSGKNARQIRKAAGHRKNAG